MLRVSLIVVAFILGIAGIVCILKAFFSDEKTSPHEKKKEKILENKAVFIGWVGLILLFGMGLILIYFYSMEPVPIRIIKDYQQKSRDTLPDISLNIIPYDVKNLNLA